MIDPDQGLLSAAHVLRVQNLEAGRVNANRVAAAVKENVEVGARYRFYYLKVRQKRQNRLFLMRP